MAVLALVATGCSDGDDGGAPATAAAPGQAALAQTGPGGEAAQPGPGVTVRGEGRVSGRPDTLTATVGVEVQRDSVDAAIADANERAQAVIDAVTGAGVAEEDVQTQDFSVRPQYDDRPGPEAGGQPQISGYVVSNLLRIRVTALDSAGEVLEAAVAAGGDSARVHGISFELRDNQALLETARENAFADARAKAEQYASLAGRDLGELVAVSEQVSSPPPTEQFAADALTEEAARAPVPVQPGQQEVTVQVTAVWSIG